MLKDPKKTSVCLFVFFFFFFFVFFVFFFLQTRRNNAAIFDFFQLPPRKNAFRMLRIFCGNISHLRSLSGNRMPHSIYIWMSGEIINIARVRACVRVCFNI